MHFSKLLFIDNFEQSYTFLNTNQLLKLLNIEFIGI